MDKSIKEAAEIIVNSKLTIALTGAGISVESGIPDFRSKGGLWDRFDPEEYASIYSFKRNPAKVWNMLKEMEETVDRASPIRPKNHINIRFRMIFTATAAAALFIGIFAFCIA